MSERKNNKLSREEIANLEIGHTEVSRAQQWSFSLFFLLFIGIYPCLQMFARQPFGEWRKEGNAQQTIKAYERAIEDTSLLRKLLLSKAQRFMTGVLHAGNEKVIVGKDGWLFFSGDYEYLINPGFLLPEKLHKRMLSGVQPDPVKAVLAFNEQLTARGIRLILLPVPVKPMIYGDKLGSKGFPLQNPSFREFQSKVEAAGVTVIDLTDELAEMRRNGTESYLKTDTHWTVSGMELAAEKIANAIDPARTQPRPVKSSEEVTNLGDIAVMLNLPDAEKYFSPETMRVTHHTDVRPDRNSDVLLLGDSFSNIYSLETMKWGYDGGLAETLGSILGRGVDPLLRNDAGAYATRQLLSDELRRGRDRLAGKKFVIWEFAARELANGDWKMLDMTPGEVPETNFLTLEKPREVTAVILAATTVPRPFSAPYKDHVMSLHLGDIDGTNSQALVYSVSMRDNVWMDPAKLRAGDTVKIRLEPWSGVEARYGSWNRSEFDDEALLLAEPLFGTIIGK